MDADPALIAELVLANHILFRQGVVDGFGHVSARHDRDPGCFLLSRSMAPALVTPDDIMTFDLDSAPLDHVGAADPRGRAPYLERFIHGEIFARRPDVICVVHSHAATVVPFAASSVPLKPIYHMSCFLRTGAPVFEIREKFGMTDMLIRNNAQGAALAEKLGDKSAVLMRGHGYCTIGSSIPEAVFLADRVVVMTERPGSIAHIYDVPLARPRSVEMMASHEFVTLTQTIRRHFFAQRVRVPADIQLHVLRLGIVLQPHQVGILRRHRLCQDSHFRLHCGQLGFLGGDILFKGVGNGSATLHDTTSCLRVLTVGFALAIIICRRAAVGSKVNTISVPLDEKSARAAPAHGGTREPRQSQRIRPPLSTCYRHAGLRKADACEWPLQQARGLLWLVALPLQQLRREAL
jgi:ribulose-5-phosphate 4-epimerase/fuculose-1-phosphate aldolase